MFEIEALERKLKIAREISAEAQRANDSRWFAYTQRAYKAWQTLEIAKRNLGQTTH